MNSRATRKRIASMAPVFTLLLIAALITMAGCRDGKPPEPGKSSEAQASTRTISYYRDRSVTVPAEITRIACGWPAQNSVIAMLGYGDRIVATTTTIKSIPLFEKFVPSISRASYCFGPREYNREELLKTRPEVLFISDSARGRFDQLENAGITVISFRDNSLRALVERTVITGEILGPDAHEKALKYREYFNGNVERVRKVLAGIPKEKRVRLYHSMGDPLSTAGKESLVQDWMDHSGAVNVAENWFSGANVGVAPVEQIISSDPDAILVMTSTAAEEIRKDPKWATVKAVRDNRVYVNPRGMFWWCRETAEEALQFLWLAKTLYPDHFRHVDMNRETKYFYKTFYGYDLSGAEIRSILHPS